MRFQLESEPDHRLAGGNEPPRRDLAKSILATGDYALTAGKLPSLKSLEPNMPRSALNGRGTPRPTGAEPDNCCLEAVEPGRFYYGVGDVMLSSGTNLASERSRCTTTPVGIFCNSFCAPSCPSA